MRRPRGWDGRDKKNMKAGLLNPRHVLLSTPAKSWPAVVEELSRLFLEDGRITSLSEFVQSVFARESLISTYCGHGIAIPHAVSKAVKTPSLGVARTSGFYWHDPDEWVRLIFLFALPESTGEKDYASMQMDVLSAIAGLALEEENIDRWLNAVGAEEIIESIEAGLAAADENSAGNWKK